MGHDPTAIDVYRGLQGTDRPPKILMDKSGIPCRRFCPEQDEPGFIELREPWLQKTPKHSGLVL